MRSVELFAGAGGLAMGMAAAGFRHAAVIEWDHDACETFRENQAHHAHSVEGWPLYEGDAREFDFRAIPGVIDVVSGGPPCQPFSLGGKHKGHRDARDMFPEAVRAVRELRPKAFIVENVKGLLRGQFADYFHYVRLQLSRPDAVPERGETWQRHYARLQTMDLKGDSPQYHVDFRLLNAANYGVPQKRERVFVVGFRADVQVTWSFPEETHSQDALLVSQWVTGEYWERHRVASRERPMEPRFFQSQLLPLFRRTLSARDRLPWLTVRDAISDLPDPERHRDSGIANHMFNPGARSYHGHTGSPIDEAAKTLKAGDHGVPGGENMVAWPNGRVRYFTVREAARLQTFPDDYVFRGAWSEAMRQLGNAVPVRLAEVVARSVSQVLLAAGKSRAEKRDNVIQLTAAA